MEDRFELFIKWCRGELDHISGKDYRAYQAIQRFLHYLEQREKNGSKKLP